MEPFDASVWVGVWPFRPVHLHVAGLEEHLRGRGIGGACAASLDAILAADPLAPNLDLLVALGSRRGDFRWSGGAIIDPTLAGWDEDVETCLRAGARCLKLVPNYHGYPLVEGGAVHGRASWSARAAAAGLSGVDRLCALAAARSLPVAVQMRMQDERTHHPSVQVPGVPAADLAALALRHAHTRFLACGAYMSELASLARPTNVWVEIAMVEGRESLPDALRRVPADRLVFGSHTPLLYTLAARVKLDAASLQPAARLAVASGSWERLTRAPE